MLCFAKSSASGPPRLLQSPKTKRPFLLKVVLCATNPAPEKVNMDYTIAESGQIEALCGEVGGLYERLKQLKDRRDPRGVRYPLAAVLMVMVLAKLSGEDEARGIAEWAKWRAKPLAKALGLKRESMPHHTTYSRIMGHAVEVEQFEAVVQGCFSLYQPAEAHMALDGKARRGTIEPGHTQGVHLLAAYLPEVGVVVGQTAVASKENEIVVAPELLANLDLQGAVVSGDALK